MAVQVPPRVLQTGHAGLLPMQPISTHRRPCGQGAHWVLEPLAQAEVFLSPLGHMRVTTHQLVWCCLWTLSCSEPWTRVPLGHSQTEGGVYGRWRDGCGAW